MLFSWFLSKAINSAEYVLHTISGQRERGKKNFFLQDDRYRPTNIEMPYGNPNVSFIEGNLPEGLSGAFLRNGPNMLLTPVGDYHIFDGDGMLHGVRFQAGKTAIYSSHFVQTERLQWESKAGRPLVTRIADMKGIPGIASILLQNLRKFIGILPNSRLGNSNTSLVYHKNKLMALVESDLPFAVKILCNGALKSLGAYDFNGKLNHPFSAHPKCDKKTGEMITFGYQLEKPPYLTVSLISAEGNLVNSIPIDLPHPVMIHDSAITDKYFIILDCPLVFEKEAMVRGSLPFVFKKRNTRIGLLSRESLRNPGSAVDLTWLELPPCFVFHTANAWDNPDGSVSMYVCRFERFCLSDIDDESVPASHLYEFCLNPKQGVATQKQVLSDAENFVLDFPRIDDRMIGQKNQFAYFVRADELFKRHENSSSSIVKVDLDAGKVMGEVKLGHKALAGEAVFAPKTSNQVGISKEDDGYLLSFVVDSEIKTSYVAVIDAASMKVTTKISIPARVPVGFHGIYLNDDEIKSQL